MSDTPTPEMQAQMEAFALNNPHQLFLVDRALKVDIGPFVSHVTLGNTNPNGQIIAVATISLSTDTLQSLVSTLSKAIADQASQIKAGHTALQKRLPKSS